MQKQIKGHPDYFVTDKGKIISMKGRCERELRPDTSTGYARVSIDGCKRYVSDIVAEHFLKRPMNPSYKIFFIDDDPWNCEVENLVWLSPSDIQRFSQYTVEYRRQVLGLGN